LFARLGAQLAITGRNAENLQKTSDECKNQSQLKVPKRPTFCSTSSLMDD
jgi:NADP-dependent 3-hydroxy acid dehydrogenase YdfG